jgi:hypothetical protein
MWYRQPRGSECLLVLVTPGVCKVSWKKRKTPGSLEQVLVIMEKRLNMLKRTLFCKYHNILIIYRGNIACENVRHLSYFGIIVKLYCA